MKSITIKGEDFKYQVFSDCDYDGCSYWTEFYKGTEEVRYKKHWLFGPEVVKVVPKLSFKVYFDIESPYKTKEEVREKLEREVAILHRAEEIKRGEII